MLSPLKAWAVIDIQKEPRWTYRLVNGRKSGVSVFFTKPKVPKGWKRTKKLIRVTIAPS